MAENKNYTKTVKNYERYREFLRNIYLYSFRSRNDFAELGIKGRTYDEYKRSILDCINNKFIEEDYYGKTKYMRFNADMYQNYYNFLVDTFFNKSLTGYTFYYIFILQLLFKIQKALTQENITQSIIDYYDDDISESSVYRILKDLISRGIIEESKNYLKQRSHSYKLKSNILDLLSLAELQELYTAASFYTNISILSVPGYYFMNTLEEYIESRFKQKLLKPAVWQYRSCNFCSIIDDEVVYNILEAIHHAKQIAFTYEKQKSTVTATPHYVATDYPYGRIYLHTKDGNTYRIDKISNVKEIKSTANINKSVNSTTKQTLELIFTFTSQDDKKEVTDIKKRLNEEAAWMTCSIINDNCRKYTANVEDALKFAPWIRSFGKYVSPGPNCSKKLTNRLYNDKKEALANYGII